MKKLGRAFNHLEDLVFFYGFDGATEASQHLKEISRNSSDIRMKWDGMAQVYWGRDYENGPLILASHNSWSQGIKSFTSQELYEFIVHKSGNPKTPYEIAKRKKFAEDFSNLYNMLDAATPSDFIGFVYADILYMKKPTIVNGAYYFNPNNTTYYVKTDSSLGGMIANSEVMVAGHAYFPRFGEADDAQVPKVTFAEFNTPNLIVLDPFYTPIQVTLSDANLHSLDLLIQQHRNTIEYLLAPIAGVSNFKDMFYKYTNSKVKNNTLHTLGYDFEEWLQSAKISNIQRNKIVERISKYPTSIQNMFNIVKYIMNLKNSVIEQLNENTSDFTIINSEGWVRYSSGSMKYGNIKLVPRHKWTPTQQKTSIEVGVCYGRFNPPHVGHKLAWESAASFDKCYIGTNPGTHDSNNPLPYYIKKEAMIALMPEIEDYIVPEQTIFTLAVRIYNEFGDNSIINVCTDEDWIVPTLIKYNGVQQSHGYYKFEEIKVHQVDRISSASSVREAVRNGDRNLFTLAAGISADYEIKVNNSIVKFFDVIKECLDSS